MTMEAYCRCHGIRIEACEMVGANPACPEWTEAHHYKVRLRRGDKRLTVHFSMGYAHNREPEAAEILECLISDAARIDESGSFEEWANELGFDIDSRKAERTYRACQASAQKLARFMEGLPDAPQA